MIEEHLPIIIYICTFIGTGLVMYCLCPKDLSYYKVIIDEQKVKKKGLLLWITPVIYPLSLKIRMIKNKKLSQYRNWIQKKLVSSEWDLILNPDEFIAIQLITPLPFIMTLLLGAFRIEQMQSLKDPLIGPIVMVVIFLLVSIVPLIILDDTIKKRHVKMSRELPFALDMITSAVSAGLDFSGAIRRFIKKTKKITPLKTELSIMLKEISLGKTRSEALLRMADRVNLNELSSVVNSLVQADQMGTSIGVVLTNLSDDLRVKRFQKAEKLAMEAPVKMLFPLILFIFPAVFIILLGPIAIQMAAELARK